MKLRRRWRERWASALAIGVAVAASAALLGGAASDAMAGAGGAKSVAIVSFAFHPSMLRVGRGGKVAFTNTSNTAHTATGGNFDTKRIKPGTTVLVRFNQKGTFAYHCKIHPFMKGKIVVE